MKKFLSLLVVFAMLTGSSFAATASKSLSITIVPAPLSITTTSCAGGQVSSAYSCQLNATGGKAPYTWSWAPNAGSQLPPGLTLAATTGLISGTPTADGTFNFTVTVTDAQTLAQSTINVTANFGASE
jgi:hypothetical protein